MSKKVALALVALLFSIPLLAFGEDRQSLEDLQKQIMTLQKQTANLQNQLNHLQLMPGPEGPAGPVGPGGAPGLAGPPGPKGDRGDRRDPGPKGDRGDPGQSIQGQQGVQGPQGIQAPAGPDSTLDTSKLYLATCPSAAVCQCTDPSNDVLVTGGAQCPSSPQGPEVTWLSESRPVLWGSPPQWGWKATCTEARGYSVPSAIWLICMRP